MKASFVFIMLATVGVACFLIGRHSAVNNVSSKSGARRVLYYVDPMHPSYKSQKPGTAPDCGMDLEPVYEDVTAGEMQLTSDDLPSGTLNISVAKQQLIGVRTELARKSGGSELLRFVGKVEPDDTRVYRVNAGVDGWLRATFDKSVGSFVKKDEKLATFYSPEFVALEQGHLVATERLAAGMKPAQAAPGTQSSAARLRNLGMSDAQIDEIARTRLMPEDVFIVSPADGFILSRNVAPGQRFEHGTEFYRIADLQRVWVMAEVAQSDAQAFRPGALATIRIPGTHQTASARVSDVLPQFDPATQLVKVRLQAQNPGFILRPDMIVDVELGMAMPNVLTISNDAVLNSGSGQHVFVDRGKGMFEPREVKVGRVYSNRAEILDGLQEGEQVVLSGNFLLDSESRMRNSEQPAQQEISIPAPHTKAQVSRAALVTQPKQGGQP